MSGVSSLVFEAPKSSINVSFWEELYKKKLNELKLSSDLLPISAELTLSGSLNNQSMAISRDSFLPRSSTTDECLSNCVSAVSGCLRNVNTIEEFRDCDKRQLLEDIGMRHIWHRGIVQGQAVRHPSLLFYFVLLSFADLKGYKFMHWYGAPALLASPTATDAKCYSLAAAPSLLCQHMKPSPSEPVAPMLSLYLSIGQFMHRLGIAAAAAAGATAAESPRQASPLPPVFIVHNQPGAGVSCFTLQERWEHRFDRDHYVAVLDNGAASFDPTASAAEPSETPSLPPPGWGMRNVLALAAATVNDVGAGGGGSDGSSSRQMRFISLRGETISKLMMYGRGNGAEASSSNTQQLDIAATYVDSVHQSAGGLDASSVLYRVDIPVANCLAARYAADKAVAMSSAAVGGAGDSLRVVGWETNERNKPGPKLTDVNAYLNPAQLLSQAANLNLQLMKWRLWEGLEVERVKSVKCLLLGAGTLGCAVARVLLGWGVNHITFVDNGKVSYSNPTRQCLFTFKDCVDKAYKATAAADAMRAINPNLHVAGEVLTIPMPGHSIAASGPGGAESGASAAAGGESLKRQTEEAHDRLLELIRTHDVIYLLTDSREARWLPSMMFAAMVRKQDAAGAENDPAAAAYTYDSPWNKIMLDVALGFDSFLVIRHGRSHPTIPAPDAAAPPPPPPDQEAGAASGAGAGASVKPPRLGCYFCNDVIGVQNTLKDRTLDQQCTVTRPGLAFMASAWAVEVMIGLLHCDLASVGSRALNKSVTNGAGNDSASEEKPGRSMAHSMSEVDIPHQIRGNLLNFTQMLPISPAFTCCTACSEPVVSTYRTQRFKLIEYIAENPKFLESLSGIDALMQGVDLDDDLLLMGDSEDEDGDEGGA